MMDVPRWSSREQAAYFGIIEIEMHIKVAIIYGSQIRRLMPDAGFDQQPVSLPHRNRFAVHFLHDFTLRAVKQLKQMMMMPRVMPSRGLQAKMASYDL